MRLFFFGSRRPHLNVIDSLELPPWEKFRYYGIFPWKMFLHLILVVLITMQANLVNDHYSSYSRAVGRNFVNLFFPSAEATPNVGDYTYHIFTINDTIKDAHKLLESYFQLPDTSVDAVAIATQGGQDCSAAADEDSEGGTCGIPWPTITMDFHGRRSDYLIMNASSPWPLQINGDVDKWIQNGDVDAMRQFFDGLSTIVFNFVVKSRGWGGGIDWSREVCLVWGLHFKYDLTFGGQFIVSIDYSPIGRCTALSSTDRYIIMCLLIGLIALIYQTLILKAMIRKLHIMKLLHAKTRKRSRGGGMSPNAGKEEPLSIRSNDSSLSSSRAERSTAHHERQPLLHERVGGYSSLSSSSRLNPTELTELGAAGDEAEGGRRSPHSSAGSTWEALRSPYEAEEITWEDLTWREKFHLFNLWNVISTIGCVCAIAYSLRGISLKIDTMTEISLRVLIGIACLMLWFSLVQYLEFNPRYYVMILTLKKAVPRIAQFLVGIMPCFIGYAMLGTILFGDRNAYFGSMQSTAAILFSIINGDSIKLVLDSLAYMPLIGEVYIYVYMMLFTYICLMTCIAIVEEAFFSSAEIAHDLWNPSGVEEAEYDDQTDKIGGFIGGGVDRPIFTDRKDRNIDQSGQTRRFPRPQPIRAVGKPGGSSTPIRQGRGSVFEMPMPLMEGAPSRTLSPPASTPGTCSGASSPSFQPSMRRNRSGRYMSAKLRHLLAEGGFDDGSTDFRVPPISPTNMGTSEGGGGGGERGAFRDARRELSNISTLSSVNEADVSGSSKAVSPYPSSLVLDEDRDVGEAAVSEALSELQTTLLREIARQAKSSHGTEEATGGVDHHNQDEATVILKAIASTKDKILRKRTFSTAPPSLPTSK